MAHKDYSKYSKRNPTPQPIARPPEPVKPKEEPEPKVWLAKGTVANCARLNVRNRPDKNGSVITVLGVGYIVTINVNKSTDTWYYIPALNGYCMKEFVELFSEVK